MVYIPPNNKEEKKEVQKAIIEKYIKRLPRMQMVVMGDFNSTVNVDMNRQSASSKKKHFKPNPLIR